jgi:quinol-cytochrome oxidoreductase complex cytochrome b subunit
VIPIHIQLEWYFLSAYAILCLIYNKLGSIIDLLSSIIILYTLKWIKYHINSNAFYPLHQLIYWIFINNFIRLTYRGRQVIEPLFISIRQILSINYFIGYFVQKILRILLNVHISKASILLKDLTLSDQISAFYNSISHI